MSVCYQLLSMLSAYSYLLFMNGYFVYKTKVLEWLVLSSLWLLSGTASGISWHLHALFSILFCLYVVGCSLKLKVEVRLWHISSTVYIMYMLYYNPVT